MRSTVKTFFEISEKDMWDLMLRSSTLIYVTQDRVRFDTTNFPEFWEEGSLVKTTVFQVKNPDDKGMPYSVTFEEINREDMFMRTREHGGPVAEWIHTMRIEPVGDNHCYYVDEIEARANSPWMTLPMHWFFIRPYYSRRHDRLAELVEDVWVAA